MQVQRRWQGDTETTRRYEILIEIEKALCEKTKGTIRDTRLA